MYKMDKKLKEELTGCDYYASFIKNAIKELKTCGMCYVYHRNQIEEIKKYTNFPIRVEQNECGFTLSVPRKYRMEVDYE